jgi:hypothetical protein
LAGQVRYEDEQARHPQPPAGGPKPPPQPHRISLQAVGGWHMGGASPAAIAPDDTFTLEGLHPGRYRMRITWGPAYVKSIRVGSSETEGDTLDLSNGAAGPVTVTISSQTCEVSGTVTDAKGPVEGANVGMLRDGDDGDFTWMAATDASGTYRFSNLVPGKYKLLAADADTLQQAHQGENLDDYADIVESIDLRPGDKLTKDLRQK